MKAIEISVFNIPLPGGEVLEQVLLKEEPTGLYFTLDASFVEQEVGAIHSPYGHGTIDLDDDEQVSGNDPDGQVSTGIYTLVYSERGQSNDAQAALNGPFVFATKREALVKVWEYVHGRSVTSCYVEFLEAFFDSSEKPCVLGILADGEDFEEFFERGCGALMEKIIDWYFELLNLDSCDGFYQISAHSLNLQANGLCPPGGFRVDRHTNGACKDFKGEGMEVAGWNL
jgi:hypothetical protein